jgi:hypothetical protein
MVDPLQSGLLGHSCLHFIVVLVHILQTFETQDYFFVIRWQIVEKIKNNGTSNNFSGEVKWFISMYQNITVLLVKLYFLVLDKLLELFSIRVIGGWIIGI